jgi:hypothetical protein
MPDWFGGVTLLQAARPAIMAATSEVLMRVFFMVKLRVFVGWAKE